MGESWLWAQMMFKQILCENVTSLSKHPQLLISHEVQKESENTIFWLAEENRRINSAFGWAKHFFELFSSLHQNIMSYGSTPYTAPPPGYDEESNQPLLGGDDDMYKETIANSSKEVRLRKYCLCFEIYLSCD